MRLLSSSLIGHAAEIAVEAFSEGKLRLLFMKANLDSATPAKHYGKAELVAKTVMTAKYAATESGADDERKALHDFVRLVAEQVAPAALEGIRPGTYFWQLREAARADGLDLRANFETTDDEWGATTTRRTGVRLLPLDDPAAPLSQEITALEADFDRLGWTDAKDCYQRAAKALTEGRHEDANGGIRAMYEAALVETATITGFASTKQGDGGAAVNYLRTQGHLADKDGGWFVHGLWAITHTNGPHPGTSTAGEAHFRFQALTAAARYLIDRFAPA
ncbi:hypothetical protein [Kitasatospora fiedleri]|uniref:hypothetical protein n=1 Tax=Kitasatospora fiedleri TaxID=2991545 RepID=UPI00249A5DF9|nr:hypothetical protein [Kitasatospora fiedleri]